MKCGALFLYCALLFSAMGAQGKHAHITESFTLFCYDGRPLPITCQVKMPTAVTPSFLLFTKTYKAF